MIDKALGDGQLVIGGFITTMYPLVYHILCRIFWSDSAYLSPRFDALWLLAFPKTKVTLKRKRFQTIDEIQENRMGSWWQLGELCEVPRCLLRRGLRHHCPVYNVSCSFLSKCLYFSCYMAGYFMDRPYVFYVDMCVLCVYIAFNSTLISLV